MLRLLVAIGAGAYVSVCCLLMLLLAYFLKEWLQNLNVDFLVFNGLNMCSLQGFVLLFQILHFFDSICAPVPALNLATLICDRYHDIHVWNLKGLYILIRQSMVMPMFLLIPLIVFLERSDAVFFPDERTVKMLCLVHRRFFLPDLHLVRCLNLSLCLWVSG
jgi:hypothetical protein